MGRSMTPQGTRMRKTAAATLEIARRHGVEAAGFASAEAQVAALSDDIAYNAHDIDDGLRAKLFDIIDLGDIPLAGEALSSVLKRYPKLERPRLVHETVRRVISAMVSDVTAESERRAERLAPADADAVRALHEPLVAFTDQMKEQNRVLQTFLTRSMYRHEKVNAMMDRARRVVRDLFEAYMGDASLLPPDWGDEALRDNESRYARQVCDFIAGMTDRYALEQHKRLFDLDPLFR